MKKISYLPLILLIIIAVGCEFDEAPKEEVQTEIKKPKPSIKEYGFTLDDYQVYRDTVRLGDSFGAIMDSHGVTRGRVFEVSEKVKDVFDPARINVGKPYTILKSKDSSAIVEVFIYEESRINYTVVNLKDSISALKNKKPVTIKKNIISGVITSSLSAAMDNEGLSILLADKLADIYSGK